MDKEKEKREEEEGMQQFVDYIKKQGLMIVEAPTQKIGNKNGKFSTSQCRAETSCGNQGNGEWKHYRNKSLGGEQINNYTGKNESVVTVYQNAVRQAKQGQVLNIDQGLKRNSTSSEQGSGLDTSDEIEKLEIDNLTVQTKNGDKIMQFISEN